MDEREKLDSALTEEWDRVGHWIHDAEVRVLEGTHQATLTSPRVFKLQAESELIKVQPIHQHQHQDTNRLGKEKLEHTRPQAHHSYHTQHIRLPALSTLLHGSGSPADCPAIDLDSIRLCRCCLILVDEQASRHY